MLLTVGTVVMANEKTCDLVGETGHESTTELAVLERLRPLFGQSFETTVEDEQEKYTYRFRMCQEVFSNYSNGGLLQINKKSEHVVVVGRINDTHIINGSEWIMLTYMGGESYDSHCGRERRKAIVMITCNPKTLASGFTLLAEEREKEKECSYTFELDSNLACPPEDSHLSVGSVLLITLASVVAVYIIGGFLYQRLVVGAKGMEQFPHFTFWQDLGNLVADGCDFVCRSKPRNVPAAYRGVGDDQLGEESEERDDHLLPM